MYYCLSFCPQLSYELAEAIEAIRRVYDPTSGFIIPHITLVFPTPGSVGELSLISHIQNVLTGWSPFEMRLGGFLKSSDHWLFLGLHEGEAEVKRLYRALHTGILADGRDVSKFVPHLGLGLFLKERCTYDWRHPRESDFDRKRYEEALRRAEVLPLSERITVETLRMTAISDAVIEWTTGKRASLPVDAEDVTVREFRLGHQGA
jgi:2'-5' RNA ligase